MTHTLVRQPHPPPPPPGGIFKDEFRFIKLLPSVTLSEQFECEIIQVTLNSNFLGLVLIVRVGHLPKFHFLISVDGTQCHVQKNSFDHLRALRLQNEHRLL